MILGALLDAGLDFELFQSELTKLNLPNYKLKQQKVSKQNLSATKFDVIDLEKKNYRHLKDLNRIVEKSGFDEKLKMRAKELEGWTVSFKLSSLLFAYKFFVIINFFQLLLE